ncbi:superoxide dismutase family protein [Sphingomicrobium nitratireducens]|uniref:superoxide dismutase family protein n=1 Tax=Sphingomicrobium nitratireducens TaxID=2964666 RepID=UPI002240C920|nr:superoxide dismutase family protein [Sphingomicrobium nitratireducens]
MKNSVFIGTAIALFAVLAGCEKSSTANEGTPPSMASAKLLSGIEATVGNVSWTQDSNGVTISLDVDGILPGQHAAHLHESGVCEFPDFQSAGGHWNPAGKQHGRDNPAGAHLGDLSNIAVDDQGRATAQFLIGGVSIEDMADADGTALVIHEGADDYRTDPSGDSGARVACAVIAPPR